MNEYEVIDHGWDHSQYFRGCGVTYSDYDHCATGVGFSPKEALENALEQMAMSGVDWTEKILDELSEEDERDCECKDTEECEHYHYVSVRWKDSDEQS